MGYRDAPTIVRATRSVVEQAAADVEIVVVTSGGDDSAARVRAAFPDLPVVEAPTRLLPGGARNAGVEATRGAVVAFLAADCAAEPGWVAARRTLHAAGHPVVASAVTNGERRHPAAWAFHFGVFRPRLGGRAAGPVSALDPAAHGCSFDRAVLERLGPFDEAVEIGEDTIAVRALDALGVPVWFEPTVRTMHWGPHTMIDLVRDRYRRGCARGRVSGPVADRWVSVVLVWALMYRLVPGMWREAGSDRRWVILSLPWMVAGNAAFLVGFQRAGRRLRGPAPIPTRPANP
jgi:glycosyltransferase involved in cell wall biosynthesis